MTKTFTMAGDHGIEAGDFVQFNNERYMLHVASVVNGRSISVRRVVCWRAIWTDAAICVGAIMAGGVAGALISLASSIP